MLGILLPSSPIFPLPRFAWLSVVIRFMSGGSGAGGLGGLGVLGALLDLVAILWVSGFRAPTVLAMIGAPEGGGGGFGFA